MNRIKNVLINSLPNNFYMENVLVGFLFVLLWIGSLTKGSVTLESGLFVLLSTALYPYSRYAIKRSAEIIIDDQLIMFKLSTFIFLKIVSILLSFIFACIFAPAFLIVAWTKETIKNNRPVS